MEKDQLQGGDGPLIYQGFKMAWKGLFSFPLANSLFTKAAGSETRALGNGFTDATHFLSVAAIEPARKLSNTLIGGRSKKNLRGVEIQGKSHTKNSPTRRRSQRIANLEPRRRSPRIARMRPFLQ